MRIIALLLAVMMLVSIGYAEARQASFWWAGRTEKQQPVEQQTPMGESQPDPNLWVLNPTDCIWDGDDRQDYFGSGRLRPGDSASQASCIMADWDWHLAGIKVCSRQAAAVHGAVTFDLGGTALGAVRIETEELMWSELDRRYCATACMIGPHFDRSSPYLESVRDSKGGVAFPVVVRFEVVSYDTQQRSVDVVGMLLPDSNNSEAVYCPTPPRENCSPPGIVEPKVCWSG